MPFVDGLIENRAAIMRKGLDYEKARHLYPDRIAGRDQHNRFADRDKVIQNAL